MIFAREFALIDDLEASVHEAIKEAFTTYGFVILDYIFNKQLFREGEDAEGKKVQSRFLDKGTAYARFTVKLKKKKGDPYDRVTWRDTGKMQRTTDLHLTNTGVSLTIHVEYYKGLVFRYGEGVLGVQEQYLAEFAENYIIPLIKKKINDTIAKF